MRLLHTFNGEYANHRDTGVVQNTSSVVIPKDHLRGAARTLARRQHTSTHGRQDTEAPRATNRTPYARTKNGKTQLPMYMHEAC